MGYTTGPEPHCRVVQSRGTAVSDSVADESVASSSTSHRAPSALRALSAPGELGAALEAVIGSDPLPDGVPTPPARDSWDGVDDPEPLSLEDIEALARRDPGEPPGIPESVFEDVEFDRIISTMLTPAPGIDQIRTLLHHLPDPRLREDLESTVPAGLIDLITELEQAQSALAALQAEAAVSFRHHELARQEHEGVPRADRGRGIADQIALARHMSPKIAGDHLALHRVLVQSLPHTLDHLRHGRISELAARRVAQSVLVLDDADRSAIDHDLAEDLPAVTSTRAGHLARARADRIDPRAAVARHARAVTERCVSIRPAPDTMVYLSALLPVHEGVAAYAALDRAAGARRSAPGGDPRSRGQIMADTLVELVTGQAIANDVPIEINLLMTDTTLLGGRDDSARIGDQIIPGAIARHLALHTTTGPDTPSAATGATIGPGSDGPPREVGRWIRRLYTTGHRDRLDRVDLRRRCFTGAARRYIRLRDQHCRTPWCDAPIRDIDHATPYADGGQTTIGNGVGHCTRFNLAKEIPGWTSRSTPGGDLTIITPTGHRYVSSPPRLRHPSGSPRSTETPSPTGASPPTAAGS